MDLLSNLATINLSGSALLLVGGVVVAILLGLVFAVIKLYQQNRTLTTPRYGFLGKPLYIAALALLAVGALYITNNINNPKLNDVNANREVKVIINTQILQQDEQNVTVKFSAIPKVGNVEWGNEGDQFTFYWDIKDQQQYSMIETNLTKSKPGGFTKQVAKGNYTITLLLIYQDKTYTVIKQVSL